MNAENHFITSDLLPFLTEQSDIILFSEFIQKKSRGLNWPLMLEILQKEGIASVFYFCLKKNHCEALLPSEIQALLNESFLLNLKRNMTAIAQAKIVFSAFRAAGIQLIVLKGLFLIEHVYPHPAMRNSSDIDILIHKSDIFRVDDCLRTLGYASKDSHPQQAIRNPSGYLASLDYISDSVLAPNLHVHWHIVNSSIPAYMITYRINIDHIWQNVIPTKIADVDVLTLSPEHSLIYLCEHALRVGHSFDRLVLIYDIYLICKIYQSRIDWEKLWYECKMFHLEHFLFISLSIVEGYTSFTMPEPIRLQFNKHHTLHPLERLFLFFYLKKIRFRGASYLIYLSMNQNISDLFIFLFRTLFPPTPILLQRQYIQESKITPNRLYLYHQRVLEILRYIWSGISAIFNNKP